MKMVELQAGLGFGVKKFSIIFVFGSDKVLDSFINSGWEFGGQAAAAAKTADKGWCYVGFRWRPDVPDDGQRSGCRDYYQGHQVLQRRRPELKAVRAF